MGAALVWSTIAVSLGFLIGLASAKRAPAR
jgi:hypothetical protein